VPEWQVLELNGDAIESLTPLIVKAYSVADLKGLARDLDVDGRIAPNAPPRDQVLQLFDAVAAISQHRRLVRLFRRHPNVELQRVAASIAPVSITDRQRVGALVELLKQARSTQWDRFHHLLRERTTEFDEPSVRVPGWEIKPAHDIAFNARCVELVEILNELPRDERLALKLPLLQFVRDIFCTPVGPGVSSLRGWLHEAAADLQIALHDLIVVSSAQSAESAAEVVAAMKRHRDGAALQTLALPEPLSAMAGGWPALLTLPAIRVGVVLTPGEALPNGVPPSATAPSYSPICVLIDHNVDGGPEPDVPAALKNVLRVQMTRVAGELMVDSVYAAVTGTTALAVPRVVRRTASPGASVESSKIARGLKDDKFALFFGPAESDCAAPPTSGFRLGHQLVASLQPSLAPKHPLLGVDVAAYAYATKFGEALRAEVADLLRLRPGPVPLTHQRVATLFKRLLAQVGPRLKPLIVTTNLDLLLERALLEAGVPFVRIVQRSNRTLSNRYELEFIGEPTPSAWWLKGRQDVLLNAPPEDDDACVRLQALIRTYGVDSADPRLPWADDDPALVLYKYHGSADDDAGCVISITDYEQRNPRQVPGEILNAIRNRPRLFVGYTVLDPQLRHLRRDLIGDDRHEAYAVHTPLPSDCRNEETLCLGRTLWEAMSTNWFDEYGVRRLDTEAADFLAAVEGAL
jgi:hypothetical protein